MTRLLLIFCICIPMITYAQEKGVRFEQDLSWQQILAKAKTENKFIFVDCYATWCGPCKLMDKDVYPKENVSAFVNSSFVSVRLQADSTSADSKLIQEKYEETHAILTEYQVFAYPTYLFFSPEGRIVHRFSGAVNDSFFIQICKHAIDPDRQYYTRLETYKTGKLDFKEMPKLAGAALANGDRNLATEIAANYLKNYSNKLSDAELMDSSILGSVYLYLGDILTSNDKVFSLMRQQGRNVDSVLKLKGFSEDMTSRVITKEIIDPRLWPDEKAVEGNPDWDKLYALLERKYDKHIAGRVILDAQIRWYTEKEDWPQITKYTMKKISIYGTDSTSLMGRLVTNNIMYEIIFKHATNSNELNAATRIMEGIVISEPAGSGYRPGYIDTYANLLYKSGQIAEAIRWEEQAVEATKDKEIQASYQKMKRNEPTWP